MRALISSKYLLTFFLSLMTSIFTSPAVAQYPVPVIINSIAFGSALGQYYYAPPPPPPVICHPHIKKHKPIKKPNQ